MNLYYLRYFVTLAHRKHYTKAAQELCITQPSLSHAITQLEKELGVPLFEKSGRNTTLTQFGEEFLTCAERTLSTLDAGIASLQRSAQGEGLIRLGLVRPLGVEFVPRLAAGFLAEHPDRELRFTFHTDVSGPLIDSLLERKFDLLFCSQPAEKLGLTAIPVLKQRLVLITPQGHPLAAKSQIALEETVPYPQIFFAKRSGIRGVIEGMFQQIGLPPHIAYETEEDEVIAGLVAQGFGIAVVPYMDLLLKLDVNILQINTPSYERDFYMVHDPRVFLSPAVNQFRQYVLQRDTMALEDWG